MIAFAQLYWPGYAYVRSYYPNFLILTKNGNWLVVEVKVRNRMDDRDVLAKQTFAETMLKASKISYHMVAGDTPCRPMKERAYSKAFYL